MINYEQLDYKMCPLWITVQLKFALLTIMLINNDYNFMSVLKLKQRLSLVCPNRHALLGTLHLYLSFQMWVAPDGC